ncbi:MAG TPA: hypothetical protein VNR87_04445 [Flavisolibacter sp.]|nr:hypothetical protein [Flavisolibacter sp.]
MKGIQKLIGVLLMVSFIACNNSATVSQPNDLDKTKNNDTNTLIRKDSGGAQQNRSVTDSTSTRQ